MAKQTSTDIRGREGADRSTTCGLSPTSAPLPWAVDEPCSGAGPIRSKHHGNTEELSENMFRVCRTLPVLVNRVGNKHIVVLSYVGLQHQQHYHPIC